MMRGRTMPKVMGVRHLSEAPSWMSRVIRSVSFAHVSAARALALVIACERLLTFRSAAKAWRVGTNITAVPAAQSVVMKVVQLGASVRGEEAATGAAWGSVGATAIEV